jgi:hypothetical protein
MGNNDGLPIDAATAARQLAAALEERAQEYALGGAIALGYWAAPRGTVDVDLTLFLPPERPSECIWILQDIGCELVTSQALASLREDGFCQVTFRNLRVDVFLPTLPFYETARKRRREVVLGTQRIMIWDAETLAVFKMMFFRRKDVADVEQMLRAGGKDFDRPWVRSQIENIYGSRDPRLAEWDELSREVET